MLLGVPLPSGSPEISVVANGVNTANGDTRNAGSVVQGGPLSFDVVVTNAVDATANLVVQQPTASDSDVSVGTFTPGTNIAPGDSAQFTVTCNSATIGAGFTADVQFTHNAAGSPFVIHVTFAVTAVPAPEIRMSIDGDVIADGGTYDAGTTDYLTDIVKEVTVANLGDANLTLTSPPVKTGDISAVSAVSTTIAAGDSATFTFTCNGSAAGGSRSGTISVANNDADENPYNFGVNFVVHQAVLQVVGNGNTISNGDVTPDAADYTQFVTKNAADNSDRTFTINNTGDASVTGINVLVPSGYTLTSAPSATIAASGTTTFTVRCNSSTPGSAAGNVTVESTELPDYVFAVACTVRAYHEKEVANLIQYLRLNETSGTNADDTSAENNDGTYSGATLNATASPVSGDNAPSFDGVNDFVNVYSAAMASDFNPALGSLVIWAKVSGAGVWTDGLNRTVARLSTSGADSNAVVITKLSTSNMLRLRYGAGGVAKLKDVTTGAPTDWFFAAITWNKASDRVRPYYGGTQQGADLTGLGEFSGSLSSSNCALGAIGTGATTCWSGYLSHYRLYNVELTAAQIAALAVAP